jgi:uncharacterized cupin superfamily protein
MKHVRVDDVEPDDANPGLRILTGALGTTELAINRYDVPPGGRIGGGYHAHHDQEEVFYVVSGVATFETEAGDVDVAPGEVIRFAPGEFQLGYNAGDEPLGLIALGAPRESREVEAVRECTACGEVFHRRRPQFMGTGVAPDEPAREAACPVCGAGTRRIGRPD